jgi:hypothetical protein
MRKHKSDKVGSARKLPPKKQNPETIGLSPQEAARLQLDDGDIHWLNANIKGLVEEAEGNEVAATIHEALHGFKPRLITNYILRVMFIDGRWEVAVLEGTGK